MKALADPSRVRFLKALEQGEWCVCHFQEASGLAQPTVSRHLQVLEAAGLAASEKRGQWVHYRLAGEGASPYAAALLRSLAGWLNEDPDTAEFLARMHQSCESRSCGPGGSRSGRVVKTSPQRARRTP